MNKRLEIIGLFLVLFLAAPSLFAQNPPPRPRGDGRIAISNYHEKEVREVVYREGNRLRPEGVREIERLFRSRGDGAEHPIDLRLIELLDAIQDHFGAETVELISGYRSPAYNRSLKLEGRGVASESLHMQGLAADIHLDEITEEALFAYATSLRAGGVGIYPRYSFVHVDVGPATRTWREAAPAERILVGTENNQNPAWSAVTDRNEYARGETVQTAITNNDYRGQKLLMNVWIERYRKGQWGDQVKLVEKAASASLDPGAASAFAWTIPDDWPFGKYRLAIFASKDFSLPPISSNEFYVKRPGDGR